MQLYNITLNNLRRRKAKMFFVLLGFIIGIATIVAIYEVIEGMKEEMNRNVNEFGVNVILTPDAGGLTFSYGGIILPEIMYDVEQLTMEDVYAIENIPSNNMIKAIVPKLMGVDMLSSGQKVTVVGTNLKEEFLVKPWLSIKNKDLNLTDNQALIGSTLAEFFGVTEGDFLMISGHKIEIYGILLESGSAEDKQVFMNLSGAQEILNRSGELTVIEMAVDYMSGSEEILLSEINQTLPHIHISNLRQEALMRDDILMRFVRFGTTISILVLFVGMLVVCLTMSSSVRERTLEIGVFRALGFRKSHIAKIILMEGTIISIIGGLIGFIIGIFIARYVGYIFVGMDLNVPWRVDGLFISIGLSIIIGLISSIYPAYKAAAQDPVEALRFI